MRCSTSGKFKPEGKFLNLFPGLFLLADVPPGSGKPDQGHRGESRLQGPRRNPGTGNREDTQPGGNPISRGNHGDTRLGGVTRPQTPRGDYEHCGESRLQGPRGTPATKTAGNLARGSTAAGTTGIYKLRETRLGGPWEDTAADRRSAGSRRRFQTEGFSQNGV